MLKKIICTILAVVSILLLTACGKTPNNLGVETVPQTTATAPSQTTDTTEDTIPAPSMGVGERGDYTDDSATEPSAESSEPEVTEPGTTEPETTEPETTEPGTTEPETTGPEDTTPVTPPDEEQITLTFEEYLAMSVEEQEAFVESFESLEDFIAWWNAAKAAQEKEDNTITGDPNVDLGDLIP